jgi:hypothetical protein
MRKIIGVMATLVLAATIPAAAGDNGLFIGGSVGQATVDYSQIDDELGRIDLSGDDMGYKLFLGYRFLNFFAVQAEYVDLGTAEDAVGTDLGTASAEVELTAVDVFGVGFLALGPIDVFAKVGMVSWDADFSAGLGNLSGRISDDGTDPAYGVGIGVQLGPIAVRGELEYFDVDNADELYLVSVGALYTF